MTKTLPEHTVYIPLCNICGWKDSRAYESTQEANEQIMTHTSKLHPFMMDWYNEVERLQTEIAELTVTKDQWRDKFIQSQKHLKFMREQLKKRPQ